MRIFVGCGMAQAVGLDCVKSRMGLPSLRIRSYVRDRLFLVKSHRVRVANKLFQPVMAPREALETRRAYLAITPDV